MISILSMLDHLKHLEVNFVMNWKTKVHQEQQAQFPQPQKVFFFVYHLAYSIPIPYQVLSPFHEPIFYKSNYLADVLLIVQFLAGYNCPQCGWRSKDQVYNK